MLRVVIVGIAVTLVGCSTRTHVPTTASRVACTPIGASSLRVEGAPLFVIDGRSASRDDLTGTCKESICRVEVLKGRAASKYGLWGDISNGVVLVYTKTDPTPESP